MDPIASMKSSLYFPSISVCLQSISDWQTAALTLKRMWRSMCKWSVTLKKPSAFKVHSFSIQRQNYPPIKTWGLAEDAIYSSVLEGFKPCLIEFMVGLGINNHFEYWYQGEYWHQIDTSDTCSNILPIYFQDCLSKVLWTTPCFGLIIIH